MIPNLQKPPRGSHAKVKARNKRVEAKLARLIREACVLRDGHCRYAKDILAKDILRPWMMPLHRDCIGYSEWAHLEDWKRFKTRGMEPAERHSTMGSAMLCTRHHELYDKGHLRLTFLSELGADGPIAWERRC